MDVVSGKTPSGITTSDQLRDQFVERVHDLLLRELKQSISQNPIMSFTMLHSIDLRWVEKGRKEWKQRRHAFSCNTFNNLGDIDVVDSNAIRCHLIAT